MADHLDGEGRPAAGRADGSAARAAGAPPGGRRVDRLRAARRGAAGWWKLAAAREVAVAEPGRRIVWIDDDLGDQAETSSSGSANPDGVLVVAPDLFAGLTHEHLDAIEAWL